MQMFYHARETGAHPDFGTLVGANDTRGRKHPFQTPRSTFAVSRTCTDASEP